ncbi:hypothetical protein [Pontiella agarivorans]|uniref:Uncharacterized protein n=1 Tax=Pontiella agarivorans TaxID=3038953 RepID=A0ABU5MVL5_9BACT|nr:hypothetical protein [Pontiella agarivorans]MDZ8118126.1 hypothetical protein [Pontiella agarivorans]
MRGHIIAEDKFIHLGNDHHLFVTQADGAENEYRFEVRRIAPGADHPKTIYEKTEDFTRRISKENAIGELLCEEMGIIKNKIFAEEELHTHDP